MKGKCAGTARHLISAADCVCASATPWAFSFLFLGLAVILQPRALGTCIPSA